MKLDRRTLLGSMAALPFAGPAKAEALPPAITALMNHPAAGYFEAPPTGSGVPLNLPLQSPQGNRTWMELFAGRAVLLDLWASWCGPCRVETPGLNALAQRHNSPRFSVNVLKTADQQTSLANMSRIFTQNRLTSLPALADGSDDGKGFFRAMKVNQRTSGRGGGLPMAALIGPDGREIARTYGTMAGGKWNHPLLMDFVARFAKAWI